MHAALKDDPRNGPSQKLLIDAARGVLYISPSHRKYSLFFDVQIVATMQTHGLIKLVTYNGTDFKGFGGIETLEPASAQQSPA